MARLGDRTSQPIAALIVTVAAVAPDVDLLLNIDHRGPTHSLTFAVGLGLLAFAVARTFRIPRPANLGLLAFAAVVSHIVLDLLTVHSEVRVLWPIIPRGFVLPFELLPSIPLDDRVLSLGGLLLIVGELAWAGALVYLAFRIRRHHEDPDAAASAGAPRAG